MDFDLVVQGPLDNVSLNFVLGKCCHPQFKNIIISHWDEDLADPVEPNYSELRNQISTQIVSQSLPDLNKTFFRSKNLIN